MTRTSRFRTALSLGWLLLGASALAQGGGRVSAFGPGEESTYAIKYLGVTAGTARITVGAENRQWGEQVLPIVTHARSESVVELFPIRDKFISYWHPAREWSVGNDFFQDENRVRRRQRMKFDHESRRATVVKQKEGGDERTHTYEIQAGTVDIAAAMFALRNKPLDVGREFELPVFTGAKSFTLRAKVERREKVSTKLGVREAFRIRVQTGFAGKFESKRDLTAFLLTDDTRLPVRIEADFVLGTVTAELQDYKSGRRYETQAEGAEVRVDTGIAPRPPPG